MAPEQPPQLMETLNSYVWVAILFVFAVYFPFLSFFLVCDVKRGVDMRGAFLRCQDEMAGSNVYVSFLVPLLVFIIFISCLPAVWYRVG